MSRTSSSKKGGWWPIVLVIVIAVVLINQFFPRDTSPDGDVGDSTGVSDRDTSDEQDTPEIDRYPNLSEDLKENLYIQSRAAGGCLKLTGNIKITVIFADDSLSRWDSASVTEAKNKQLAAITAITASAKNYGQTLNISCDYKTASVADTVKLNDSEPWAEKVLASAGLPAVADLNNTLEEQFDVNEAPVVICINRAGRSFALQSNRNYGEYVVLYNDGNAFAHELYHLFGAEDFYYPESVEQLAENLFPQTIMMNADETKVDALTAYLIGWTDTPSADALSFLQQTNSITAEQLSEEHAKETYTGYVTDHKTDGGYYTGYLKDGVLHGEGTYTWNSGASYSGTWVNGSCNGQGTYTWASGDSYTGGWVNGNRTGKGTYIWANGDKYVGDFVDDMRTGQGTLTWASGNTYTGAWKDDERTGKGTFTWTDGTKYVGDFVNGDKHGQGTMTWSNGDKYVGGYVNDSRSGFGTYYWPNGTTYAGNWKDNKKHGTGTTTWSDGTTQTGTWENDEFVG